VESNNPGAIRRTRHRTMLPNLDILRLLHSLISCCFCRTHKPRKTLPRPLPWYGAAQLQSLPVVFGNLFPSGEIEDRDVIVIH